MRMILAALVVASAMAFGACQTDEMYDGVSRFADTVYWDRYYGPGSPPRDG